MTFKEEKLKMSFFTHGVLFQTVTQRNASIYKVASLLRSNRVKFKAVESDKVCVV